MRAHRGSIIFLVLSVPLTAAALSGDARACGGGGLVTAEAATVGANVQRVFVAVRPQVTEAVTQVAVPATAADYGVLIPLPARPTVDDKPR
jgi:hypothetical protein